MSLIHHRTFPIRLRSSRPGDVPFIIAAERHVHNRNYVGQWSDDRHQAAIDATDMAHLTIERLEDGERVGYAILEGLQDPNQAILLRRIVITEKGKGYGRATLRQLKTLVFETYHAHRFWLDVKGFNPRARRLYESEGFVEEGCLREALKTKDGYHSIYIMAILRSEVG
jgi:RimJ/RimL family protein N-acetyltransferase